MKLELHVDVDLRAPRWLRRALVLGIPLTAMAITGNVLGAPKHTFVPTEKLSATKMNENFVDLDQRSTTAWGPYMCTVIDASTEANVGGDESSCFYRRVGDSLEIRIRTFFVSVPEGGHPLAWRLPPGFAIDPTRLPLDDVGTRNVFGYSVLDIPNGAVKLCAVRPYAGTDLFAAQCDGASSSLSSSDANLASSAVLLTFSVPVTPAP